MVIRTEASRLIGAGHVVRCLTLASALRGAGARVRFVCRERPGDLCERIEQSGFGVERLPPAASESPSDPWNAGPWEDEARASLAAIERGGPRPQWLICDHYAIDDRTEKALRTVSERILVIDDLANRRHDCDVLLDQNLIAGMQQRYNELVAPDTAQLLGPRFALLQPEYVAARVGLRLRQGPVERILVFFSGADVDNLTGLTLDVLASLGRPDIGVDVVITGAHQFASDIASQVARASNLTLYRDLPSLAPLMARADLAIGATGVTSWERACLGLPSLAISMSDNQRAVAAELHRSGVVRWIGHTGEVNAVSLRAEVSALVNAGIDPAWSARCAAVVDGAGAARVSDVLLVNADTDLRLRRAEAADEGLLLEWANDPATRANAFSTDPVTAEGHQRWFAARRDSATTRSYVAETATRTPVGQVRFDRHGQGWEIDYSVAPVFRGRRLAGPLLRAALRELGREFPGATVLGRVKPTNQASARAFRSLGFECRSDERGEVYTATALPDEVER